MDGTLNVYVAFIVANYDGSVTNITFTVLHFIHYFRGTITPALATVTE